MTDIVELTRRCGIVGAGGAGFPAYKKMEAKADTVIANGAECEPLLHKDKHLLENFASDVVAGLALIRESTGAQRAVIGIKGKNSAAIEAVTPLAAKANMEIATLEDVYPAGDEVDLVYKVTGRHIPPAGIPLEVGVVVNNVETLYNIQHAMQGSPVTHTIISVTGAVKYPKTFWMPVGASYAQAIEFCGGPTVDKPGIIDGGPMMGKAFDHINGIITKTCGGLIVLPDDHTTIMKKMQTVPQYKRIGKSACDQCSLCTELCPRYMLGYPVVPHLVMRALQFSGPASIDMSRWAQICCECNICSLYACPEGLNPRDICISAKDDIAQADARWDREELNDLMMPTHPMREYRQVPTKMLRRRLGLDEWDNPAPFTEDRPHIDVVSIPLKQHIGTPANATVAPGDRVSEGDVIGKMADGDLGAWVHASIDGIVKEVNHSIVIRGEI